MFEQSNFCKKCKRRAQAMGMFVTCTNCSSKSLLKNSESRFLVKAIFMKEDEGKVMLTKPHEIFVKFCKLLGKTIHDDEDIQLLTTSNVFPIYFITLCLHEATMLFLKSNSLWFEFTLSFDFHHKNIFSFVETYG